MSIAWIREPASKSIENSLLSTSDQDILYYKHSALFCLWSDVDIDLDSKTEYWILVLIIAGEPTLRLITLVVSETMLFLLTPAAITPAGMRLDCSGSSRTSTTHATPMPISRTTAIEVLPACTPCEISETWRRSLSTTSPRQRLT